MTQQRTQPLLSSDISSMGFGDVSPMRAWTAASDWMLVHYQEILIALVVGTLIYMLLAAARNWAARAIRKGDRLIGYRQVIARPIAKTGQFFMIMIAAKLVVSYGNAPGPLERTISFLFTVSAVWQVAVWVREIVIGLIEKKSAEDPEHHETLASAMTLIRVLVSFVVFAIAAIVILDNLGVNVTGLIAGLGVGGIAIGLAAQGIFSDLFAALSIIFDKPFRVGETIAFDDTTATVQKIGLKSTRLQAITGEQIIISNTNLLDKQITNWARMGYRRQRMGIGVIYQTEPDKARAIPELLKELVEKHGAKFTRSGFVGFGDSSINFEVDFDFIEDTSFDAMYERRHALGLDILQTFNERGYEFAYPTQTTFTAAPDGEMILPYPEVMPVLDVENGKGGKSGQ